MTSMMVEEGVVSPVTRVAHSRELLGASDES